MVNESVHKLRFFDHEFLLSAYADDTTFFVQDIDSVISIFTIFGNFSIYSGFKLNKSKCEVCGIGALKGVPTALCNVKNVSLKTHQKTTFATQNCNYFTDFISLQ